MKMRKQRGFTLMELVVVMVVLGILAAIAVPKFEGITQEAHNSTAEGLAGALSSASAINYAIVASGNSSGNGATIGDCDELTGLLNGALPSGYAVSSGALTSGTAGTCTITGPESASASFTAIGAST